MNIPINCPCCNAPLLNSFVDFGKISIIRKQCHQINHNFKLVCSGDKIASIHIEIDPNTSKLVTWNFLSQSITLSNTRKNIVNRNAIPWFEPDLSDYKALINKLRTYICFM